jgi:hypothetical protein
MLKSMVGQWTGSTPLKKAKCTIVVYSIGEFISSQLPGCLHTQLGRCYTLGVGLTGRSVRVVVSTPSQKGPETPLLVFGSRLLLHDMWRA